MYKVFIKIWDTFYPILKTLKRTLKIDIQKFVIKRNLRAFNNDCKQK